VLSQLNISEHLIKEIFNKVDLDKDGYISFKEFVSAIIGTASLPSEERVKHCFDAFDLDKDGTITLEELSTRIGRYSNEVEIFREVFAEIDLNHDGEIDYNEFREAIGLS
jgi:Ca2+-binding EF-hand superfamily protein